MVQEVKLLAKKYLQFGSRDTEEERCGEMRKLEKF